MILQRLSQSIRKQDWFTVLIETLIVVLGVFLGLQLGNWNEARNERARQAVLLEELVEDLRADIVQLDQVLDFNQLRFGAAELLVERATGWTLGDTYPLDYSSRAPSTHPDAVVPADAAASDVLYFAQRFAGFDMQTRTYSATLATGDVSFAGRPELAEKIRSHYAFAEEFIRTEITQHRTTNVALLDAFSAHGLSISEDIGWDELVEVVRSDPKLVGQLKATAWQAAVQHVYIEFLRQDTLDLIEAIEGTE